MMYNRLISVILSICVWAFLLNPGSLEASESRMNSLSNSPLVMDLTDIADFPGMLAMYGNSGFVTVEPAAPGGNAGLLLGDDTVFGFWILRDPRFDDVSTSQDVFNLTNSQGITLPDTYNIADLFLGMSNGFGIRTSVSAGLETAEAVDGSDYESTGSSAFGLELQPGYTMVKDDYQGDFGLGLSFTHYKIAVRGEDVYTGRLIPSVLLRHRSTIGSFADSMNWVFDVLVTRRSYAVRHNPTDDKMHVGDWYSTLVLGPRFNLPNNFAVTAGLKGQFEARGGKVDGDKTPKRFGIGAPGLLVSAELLIKDMVAVRAGVDYSVYWGTARFYDADDELIARGRIMGQLFNWSAGLGLKLRSFQIDGTLSQQLILDGPDMLGGTTPGFLGMLSATYSWQ